VVVWRDQAEHAAQSLAKGSRVVVVGRLQQRARTAEDGSARSTVEVVADERGRACDGRPPRRSGPPRASATRPCKAPRQRRLMSMSQTSDRVTGGPSSGYSTQVPTTVPCPQSA
jgi:single-stranded DNA-binding protein